jgi:hypothetical protein
LSGFKNVHKSLFWYIGVQEFSGASPLFDDVFEHQFMIDRSVAVRIQDFCLSGYDFSATSAFW